MIINRLAAKIGIVVSAAVGGFVAVKAYSKYANRKVEELEYKALLDRGIVDLELHKKYGKKTKQRKTFVKRKEIREA